MKILVTLLISLFTLAADSAKIPDKPLKLNLQVINHNNEYYLAANFKNHDHWHTYWINPGDAGLPIEAKFNLQGKEAKLETLEWPIPKKFIEQGDIQTFGYEGEYSLFYKLPSNFNGSTFDSHFKWLICKNICIPGEKKVSGTFSNNELITSQNDFAISQSTITERLNNLPKNNEAPPYLDINMVKTQDGLAFIYNIQNNNYKINPNLNILNPYQLAPFAFKRETLYKDSKGNLYAMLTMDWDGEYMEPELPLPVDGNFKEPFKFKFLFSNPVDGQIYNIEKSISKFSLNTDGGFQTFFKMLKPITVSQKESVEEAKATSKESGSSRLLYFMLMAFIGGLILNVMPCVLPVISLKLFGLIHHSGDSKKSIFLHNLAYTLGVLFTFLGLAAVIIALKGAGQQVGWGFQLQSPTFVGITIIVLFTMALNMFGLFEFKTPGGSKLGNIEIEDTFTGDFFGGVLATILSTPCSAPFLGTALTFAFTESNTTIFIIFTFIALGLAFPFIVTAFVPSLIKFLPKPGLWMDTVKKLLGFTLIITTIWLLDLFGALTDSSTAMLKFNIALSLVFFLFYVRAKISKNMIISFFVLTSSFILFFQALSITPLSSEVKSSLVSDKNRTGKVTWIPWSEEKMKEFQDQKQLTFIDFTAKWCITCKVNEKLVLDTSKFADLVERKNVKLLLGDWTKRDPIIGAWLMKNGFVGVPAYFVINSKGQLMPLGETITLGEIEKALD